jgi:hypothetical protein
LIRSIATTAAAAAAPAPTTATVAPAVATPLRIPPGEGQRRGGAVHPLATHIIVVRWIMMTDRVDIVVRDGGLMLEIEFRRIICCFFCYI